MIFWIVISVLLLLIAREVFLFYAWVDDLRRVRDGFDSRLGRTGVNGAKF
jgi:hypothetical protein